jgi:hypothetical protein
VLLPVDLQRMGKLVMLELGEQRAGAVAGCGHTGGGRHRLAARCCANQGRGLGRSLLRALGRLPLTGAAHWLVLTAGASGGLVAAGTRSLGLG